MPTKPSSRGGSARSSRLASLLAHELSEYFKQELELPGLVSISHVDVAPNMQAATVWLSIYGADEGQVLRMIAKERKNMQARLAQDLFSRNIPQLNFRADPSEAYAQKINETLRDLDAS